MLNGNTEAAQAVYNRLCSPLVLALLCLLGSAATGVLYVFGGAGHLALPRNVVQRQALSALNAASEPAPSNKSQQPRAILHFVAACDECGLDACTADSWTAEKAGVEEMKSLQIGVTLNTWTCRKLQHPITLIRSSSTNSIFVVEGELPAELQPEPQIAFQPLLQQKFDDIVFVVYTDSLFHETRLTYLLETWGSQVAPESLYLISDKPATILNRTVQGSNCEAHSHEEGACCKYAIAVYSAYQWSQSGGPERAWAYFTDDDAYVAVGNMVQEIRRHGKTLDVQNSSDGAALGIFGCMTTSCHGLCAGGGFALSRSALERLVRHPATMSENEFVSEQMKMCKKCDRWADQALSAIIQQRRIKEVPMIGLYGWSLSKVQFMQSINAPRPPLIYHYIRSRGQMLFLHGLFGPDFGGFCQTSDVSGPCLKYYNRTCCAASDAPSDVPWVLSPSQLARRLRITEEGILTDGHHVLRNAVQMAGLQGPWPLQALAERFSVRSKGCDGFRHQCLLPGTLQGADVLRG